MKILVPVDGSSASVNAVKKAIEIAKKYGFSIKLISVVDVSAMPKYRRNDKLWGQVDGSIIGHGARMPEMDEVLIGFKENAAKILDAVEADLDFQGVKVEKRVLVGAPYEEILETARNEKFDLIVMGNRGFSKIKRFFVGSVAQKVISEAPCPVLVIHSEASF